MTTEAQTDQNSTETKSELEVLKDRARTLGINFSNNIKVETLREKINAKLEGTESQDEETEEQDQDEVEAEAPAAPAQANPLTGQTAAEAAAEAKMNPAQRKMAARQKALKEATKLIRCRITCMDPKKKDIPGEVITTGNGVVGTIKKYVPFGEQTENGYHIPKMIYDVLNERQFLHIRQVRDKRTGTMITKTQYVKEFALEILPALTQEELNKLAASQAAAGGLDD